MLQSLWLVLLSACSCLYNIAFSFHFADINNKCSDEKN